MSKRQFSDADKKYAIERFGMVCFVANHPLEGDDVEYDHIEAFAGGGASDKDNIAPVCRHHNRSKRDMSLLEYRDKLALDTFFDFPAPRILNDILSERKIKFGQTVYSRISDSEIVLTDQNGKESVFPLYQDPVTQYFYFYAKLPVSYIQNDKELQPRPLESKRLWELYRHLRRHTQLSPSIGRLVNNQILIFDGQHKIAAQVWAGHSNVDCKIYLSPDIHDIMQTNLDAHYSLKQMSFYSSIMVGKLAQLLEKEWHEFMSQPGFKSEESFIVFIANNAYGLSKAEAKKRLVAAHTQAIVESSDPENLLTEFISERNRNRKMPLTLNTLDKTLFHHFLTPPPVTDEFESGGDYRSIEIKNIVRFMNILAETTLVNKWNPERNDPTHQKSERFYLGGSIRAWSEVLRDAITASALQLISSEDRAKIFYREVTDAQFEKIQQIVTKLFSHALWIQPWNTSIEGLRVANNEAPRQVFKDTGLTASWVLGMET